MRDLPVRSPARASLLLLWAFPALLGGPFFLGRTAQAGGEVDRVGGLDAKGGGGSRSGSDLTTAARTKFAPVALTGSPDGIVAPSTAAPRAPVSNAPTNEDLAVLAEVNRLRALRSLPSIRFDARLFVAARAHSDEQLATNYLGHGSSDPERAKLSQRLTQAGYVGRMYAEVVAQNYADATSVVAAWMESPSHREVLLDPNLTEGAFCRLSSPEDPRVNRWTGDFGAPVSSRAASVPAPAARSATPAPRSEPVTPPVAAKVSVPPSPAPRSQPLPPPTNRAAVQPAPRMVTPGLGSSSVPAPAFGPASSYGNAVPPAAPAPSTTWYAPPPASRPAYVAPAPVPYRAPVLPKRLPRRTGGCAT